VIALRAAAIVTAMLAAGCHISVMGGDPITIIGGEPAAGGMRAGRRCGEPDDARRARTREDGCAARCRIDVAERTTDCEAVRMDTPRAGVATLDLSGHDGVIVTVEVCDPTGHVFQLADSPTSDADGGDAGTSAHDASVLLEATTLQLYASEGSGVPRSSARHWVAERGCSNRTLVLADQLVYLVEGDAGLCGSGMLRVNPPTDAEGTPDALWYLALAGTADGSRSGSGLRSVTLCYW
jgi:hypothetical protein